MTYPDPVTALQTLGLGKYIAGLVACAALAGFVVTHILPFIPAPTAASAAWWRVVYGIMSRIAGNYLNAANKLPPPTMSARTPGGL